MALYSYGLQVLGMILDQYLVVNQEKIYKLVLHRYIYLRPVQWRPT